MKQTNTLPDYHQLPFVKQWESNQEEFFIYTSGSTGKPKKIALTRRQMQQSAELTAKAFNLKKNDSILVNLNTNYIAGIMMLVRGLHLNLNITIVEPTSNPLKDIPIYFDFYAFVPLQLQTIIEQNESHKLKKAKAIIVGGAPISGAQEALFLKQQLPIYATYGMTETCTHVAIRKIGEQYFKALDGVLFSIDSRNCLVIESPTAIENPLITNDVVELLSATEFIWKGRFDNIINSGGIKILVEELEAKLSEAFIHKNIRNRFVILKKTDDKLGEKITLWIEGNPFDTSPFLQHLSKFEKPKEVHFVSNFPETETGKIDRNKISAL